MDSKLVLYIGGFELPDKNAAAQRVISNAKLFSKLGYKVSFIGVTKGGTITNIPVEQSSGGLTYYSCPQQYPTTTKEWLSFIVEINFVKGVVSNYFANKVDIIIAYNYPAVALYKLMNYCKANNIKLVADVTEWYQPQGNIVFRIVKGLDTFFRMNILQKKVDGLIVISGYLQKFYKNKNIVLLPPLIDKSDKKWAEITYTDSEKCKLVYVGSPGNGQKDKLGTIIASLSRIKEKAAEFSFTIIGISEMEYAKHFGASSISEDIQNNISFEGRLPHEEALGFIKKSDYSIFLRDKNLVNTAGFPTKFVESLACGTPVLTNRTSNIGQYLVEGELGYFIDDSSNSTLDNSLIKAINQDRKQIAKMKKACFNYMGFDFNLYEKELITFIEKI